MKIKTTLEYQKDLSIALGFFDGLHKGHRCVIKSAVNYAKEHGVKSAVFTFENHPHCFFRLQNQKYIRQSREELFNQFELDYLYIINFDRSLANLSAEEYLQNLIIKHFSPRAIFTGSDHQFGKNRDGDQIFLENMQKKYNYEYFKVPMQKLNDVKVSSSLIKNILSIGDIEAANKMLEYPFYACGDIIFNDCGYKVIEILYPENLIEIPCGIYESQIEIGCDTFNCTTRLDYAFIDEMKSEKLIMQINMHDINESIKAEHARVIFLKMINM